jgi:hypothetical protein
MSSAEKGSWRQRLAASLRRHPATVIATVALLSSMIGTATATQVLVVKETRTVVKAAPAASDGLSAQAAKKKKKARRGPRGPQGPAGPAGSLIGTTAGGDLAGSFPNPVVAPGAITPGKIGTIPAVSATENTAVNFPNATPTVANLDGEHFDTANMHSTGANNSRLVAPITGIYQVSGHVNWAADIDGERIVDLYRNGAFVHNMAGERNNDDDVVVQPFASLVRLTAGQYVELVLFHTAGAPLMVRADEFSMHWVGP